MVGALEQVRSTFPPSLPPSLPPFVCDDQESVLSDSAYADLSDEEAMVGALEWVRHGYVFPFPPSLHFSPPLHL